MIWWYYFGMSLYNLFSKRFCFLACPEKRKNAAWHVPYKETKFSRDTDDEAQQCNDDKGINGFLELAQQRAQGFLGTAGNIWKRAQIHGLMAIFCPSQQKRKITIL